MSSSRVAASFLALSSGIAGFSALEAPAGAVSGHESAVYQLAHDPAKIKMLGREALSDFEKNMSHGGDTIWMYFGVCAVISERYPYQPKGVEVAAIVPNPGILHMKVPNSNMTFTESIAWDPALKKYALGQVSIISPNGGQGYNAPSAPDQFNLDYQNSDLRVVDMHYSNSANAVYTDYQGGDLTVMNDAAVAIGKSAKAIAAEPSTQQACKTGSVQYITPIE